MLTCNYMIRKLYVKKNAMFKNSNTSEKSIVTNIHVYLGIIMNMCEPKNGGQTSKLKTE